jgi:branched-chain amino acid transport system permease protein
VSTLLALIVSGIAQGSTIALVAVGFLLLYSATKVINFAHGDLMALGAYVAVSLSHAGLATILSYVVAVLAVGVVGLLIERIAYAPLRDKSPTTFLIVTLGISLVIEAAEVLWQGGSPLALTSPLGDKVVHLPDVVVADQYIAIIVTAACVVGITLWVIYRTQFGRQVRAMADNREVALLLGVRAYRIGRIAFISSAMLAAIAGVLYAPIVGVTPTLGFNVLLMAFAAAIVAGFDKIWLAALAALGVGLLQQVVGYYVLPAYSDVFPLLVIFVVVAARPQGTFGAIRRVRV